MTPLNFLLNFVLNTKSMNLHYAVVSGDEHKPIVLNQMFSCEPELMMYLYIL